MDVALAVEHQTGFTLELFKNLLEKKGGDESNTVMSPVSITTAVAMAGAGAKGNTLTEITTVLKLPQGESMHQFTSQIKGAVLQDGSLTGGPLISFVNGMWVAKSLGLKPKFKELLKENYGAEAKAADFRNQAEEERAGINSWVLEVSKGKIQDLLPPYSLNNNTSLVLANALYFKGKWAKAFESADTTITDFHLLNGETVQVPFLTSGKKQYIRKFESHRVLKLPYAQGEDRRTFSMYFLLPNEKNGLPEFEKNLDAKSLTKYLNSTSREVDVDKFLIPKFKISTGFEVPDVLKSLGLQAPFSQGADFSNMVEGPDGSLLFISNVFHKAFVEVNEEGTEAAAATALLVMPECLPDFEELEDFVADHPFLFVLRENVTGSILFIGRCINPSLGS